MQNISRDLIEQAAAGDKEAFEQIYRATCSYVYTVALRVTNNREDAEEVTQDVFLSIYRNLGRFRFGSSFKTWLYRITVNTAINAARKRSREAERTTVYDETVETKAADRIKEETTDIERGETEELVMSMLDILSPEQRACVVLKDIEGLRYREIAGTLGININTVRSRLKRARERLIARNRREVRIDEVR